MSLVCGNDRVIRVMAASYGRHTDASTCGGPVRTTDCDADSSYGVVSGACNGKRTCEVLAGNSVFGDPCVGTFKYLDVAYACE